MRRRFRAYSSIFDSWCDPALDAICSIAVFPHGCSRRVSAVFARAAVREDDFAEIWRGGGGVVDVFGVFSIGAAVGVLLRRCFDAAASGDEAGFDTYCAVTCELGLVTRRASCRAQHTQFELSSLSSLGVANGFDRVAVCFAERDEPADSSLEVANWCCGLSSFCDFQFRFVRRAVELPFLD